MINELFYVCFDLKAPQNNCKLEPCVAYSDVKRFKVNCGSCKHACACVHCHSAYDCLEVRAGTVCGDMKLCNSVGANQYLYSLMT